MLAFGAGLVQMSFYGFITYARVRLAGVLETKDRKSIIRQLRINVGEIELS